MWQQTRALFWMIRPHSAILGSLYILIGIYIGDMSAGLSLARILASMAIVFIVIAYSFIINDLCDLDVDRIAKPDRPLPAGVISVPVAQAALVTLAGTALMLAFWLGWAATLYVLGSLAFTSAYSLGLKQVPFISHMTVGGLNASIILFAVFVNGSPNEYVYYLMAVVFLYSSASELLYAVQDREGDLAAGIQTTATRFGQKTSLYIFRVVISLLAVWGLVPVMLQSASQWYSYSIVPLGVMPLVGITIYLTFVHDLERGIGNSRIMMKAVRYIYLVPVLLLPLQV